MTPEQALASRSTPLARELASQPGRCPDCAWHVRTQGHEEHCPASTRPAAGQAPAGLSDAELTRRLDNAERAQDKKLAEKTRLEAARSRRNP